MDLEFTRTHTFVSGDVVLMDSRSTSQYEKASLAWTPIGPSPQETLLTLTFAIKQRNTDLLLKELDSISNPLSPRYGKVSVPVSPVSLPQFFKL